MPVIAYFVWAFSLVLAFLFGYRFKQFSERLDIVEEVIKQKIDKPKEVEESPSQLIDPYDVVAEAIYEAEKERKRLDAIK